MIVANIVIGLLTILANIYITNVNAGKNRKIYEIKKAYTGEGKSEKDINEELGRGDYSILFVGQDFSNTRRINYILGRVK